MTCKYAVTSGLSSNLEFSHFSTLIFKFLNFTSLLISIFNCDDFELILSSIFNSTDLASLFSEKDINIINIMIDNMLNSVTKVRLVKKIGILVPCTSNGRDWTTFKETYLFNMTLKSFLLSYDKEHTYTFYIGIDSGDKVFDDKETHKEIVRFLSVMKNVNVSFIYLDDAAKGHLTKMWNILFEIAYKENNDYYQSAFSEKSLMYSDSENSGELFTDVENYRTSKFKHINNSFHFICLF